MVREDVHFFEAGHRAEWKAMLKIVDKERVTGSQIVLFEGGAEG